MHKYKLIVCGGTFDLLHKGHKKFLQDVLNLSDKVLLGITSNSYAKLFKDSNIEDYETRKKAVIDFIQSVNAKDRVEIVSIDTAYEPLLENKFKIEVLAVTPETQQTAIEINDKRKNLGLSPLEIVIIEMEKSEDGELISSTRIRRGEINRDGRLYVNRSWLINNLILPQSLRSELQKPFGRVLASIPSSLNPEKTITIGDVTTQKFNQENVGQFLSIVDFAVHREKRFDKLSELGFADNIEAIEVENPAGSIAPQLFVSVRRAFESKGKQVILVKGEEDLAFLPVMLLAPLGFFVYYGQPARLASESVAGGPDKGLVEVLVTEERKEKVFELISKFTS